MSTNISKKKRDDLLDKIKQIRAFITAAPQDENTGNLLSYLSELEKDVNGKKYGLVFEEHREEIDEVLDTHTPVLTEDADLFIDHGGQMNFLLEGDNLAALKLLEKTHRGNIDLIFIDPPYNTRNGDFGYDDSRVDLTDTFRHSKWVSFMSERLLVARRLLKNDGVIFIAIDDNEQAALKLLCDQLFGEENFLASIIWQHSIQPKGYSGTFSVHHNYILCYQKTAQFVLNSLPRTDEDNKAYANPDNDPRGRWRSGDVRNALYRPNLIYDIISPSGNVIKPCANGWRWSKETVEEKIKSGEIIFSKDETRIIRKIYLDTLEGRTPETIWFGKDVGTTRSAMSEIKEIFGSSAFGTPKPTSLIERTLRLISRTDATVLDFFAGSGTTGHAVMKLNAEDGGTRRFILCTNNENGICRDVTYERIRRVIDKEDYAASLKYYAILVSFSVAIISILVTADNANIKSLKEEMADSTQYKPVGGKHLSLFQILLSNIAYNVIVEIIYLVILIGIALIRPIIPLQALKYVAAVCIFAIMHILGVLLESVAQMYLTFWRNR